MNWRDFLPLATRLAAGTTEADWRTAVSRAHYAAFHAGRAEFGYRGLLEAHGPTAGPAGPFPLTAGGRSPKKAGGAG